MTLYEIFLILKLILAVYFILFIHKWGHYCFALLSGIKVKEFNVGRGPLLYRTIINNCQCSFHLIPVSGKITVDLEQFQQTSFTVKLGYLLAGAIANLFLYLLCYGYFSYQQTEAFFNGVIQAFKGIYHLLLFIPSIKITTIYSPDRDLIGQLELYNSLAQLMDSAILGIALLSLLYAMINLLPIPGLDGGGIILLFLEKIGSWLGIKESLVQKFVKTCLIAGTFLLFSPFIINNLWSIRLELNLTIVEMSLWISLFISIIMNIQIFLEKQDVIKKR
ncbi:site-2 protease family protein [Alkalihalobacillus sp. BA299]|uniref:site-2 protease family protein n=1 Tax=Alkalihalobacillus sp. BA299 TaxID=2815938 RepID=UPI001ADA8B00|nr:site-2 protease family protein [Alkalihalobacillus sp. BA299]